MAFYELVFIVRPDVVSNHVDSLSEKFTTAIKDTGGKVVKSEQWGLRNLAYRINKHRRGYYVMFNLEGNGDVVDEVERQMRLSDDVIRYLTIRIDEISTEPSIMMNKGKDGKPPYKGKPTTGNPADKATPRSRPHA